MVQIRSCTRFMIYSVLVVLIAGILSTCSSGGSCIEDTDGDRLTDCEEAEYGTSYILSDTDGDSYTDYDEIFEYGFDATNPFKFNPLVPDVPILEIEIATIPDIQLDFTESASHSVTREEGSSTSHTDDTSYSFTQSVEMMVQTGGSLFGPVASAEFTVGFSAEESFGWSDTQTTENSTAYDQTDATDFSGGRLAVQVKMRNDGNLAFTVQNAVLGAVMVTPRTGELHSPLTNLEIESAFGFPVTTLGPGDDIDSWTFAGSLTTGDTRSLLKDSTGMVINVASYEVSDPEGQSFTHHMTGVAAKSALVVIDYGGKDSNLKEKHGVATNVDPDNLGTTLGAAMAEVFAIPYTVGENGLAGVRGTTENPIVGGGVGWCCTTPLRAVCPPQTSTTAWMRPTTLMLSPSRPVTW